MSGGGEVVCAGWLRKSPPEKKLRRYAWKKRWFILRSGRMSGDPDVLEYYKNDHSKKPLRVINLSFCEQVDAGLTFNKKELQDSFVFDIKTSDRTFYLVAETEEDMNKWVHSICQICGFNQEEDSASSKPLTTWGGGVSGQSSESVNDGFNSFVTGKAAVGHTDSSNSEDNYVPMNPGSSSLLAMERSNDNSQSVYIPMSPGPHHFDHLSFSPSALSVHRGPSRGSEIQPPPVNRNLKPDRKAKPTPLDLRNNTVIDELPFKSPVTKSWSRAIHTFNTSSSQSCRPVSTQSITSTDSGDSEENYVPMQNPVSASPVPSGTNSPAPKKSTGSVDYLALDFQPSSPSPHRKPSTSSITSDEKVDYVQVDKEKTQALQNTMQEWTDVRQSSEPSKGGKL
ncbi:GRB2-associated-binding protein 2 [Gracilinanus agilis]|uniref:GRB2-associated-binding protein 2 n=1 Tax=Gracilinanus agilis TaxID=191870 RepID=UPI001CFD08D4|nr:GRB2-associated-binding protein 2 [Gracilinanus agilis]